MSISATALRAELYKYLDEIASTGQPLEFVSKGRTFHIYVKKDSNRIDMIQGNPDAVVGDLEDLASTDWSGYWTPIEETE